MLKDESKFFWEPRGNGKEVSIYEPKLKVGDSICILVGVYLLVVKVMIKFWTLDGMVFEYWFKPLSVFFF